MTAQSYLFGMSAEPQAERERLPGASYGESVQL